MPRDFIEGGNVKKNVIDNKYEVEWLNVIHLIFSLQSIDGSTDIADLLCYEIHEVFLRILVFR